MPEFVREKVLKALNETGRAPSRSKVLILGMAYKKDINDYRESPAVRVAELLLRDGVQLAYHDPYIPEITIANYTFKSEPLTEELVSGVNLVVIITDHSNIDDRWLVEKAWKIVDTRNVTKAVPNRDGKVVLL
jgi:UDP-N-acetyl-D-mannosaminuronate dehydrogenase